MTSYWAIYDPKGELQPTALAGSQNIMMLYRFTLDLVHADVLATWVGAPPFFYVINVLMIQLFAEPPMCVIPGHRSTEIIPRH